MYSITEPMTRLLDSVHTVAGIPWWLTLVAGGAMVRASLFPLTLKGQRATEVVVSAFTRASKDVEQQAQGMGSTVSDSRMDTGLVELARQYVEERRKHECDTPHPVWMILSPAVQLSVLIYGLYSVKSMSHTHWPGFDSGGPPWAVDLTLPAVDWITMTTPLGAPGIIMPAFVMVGLHLSIRSIRPSTRKGNDSVVPEQVQIREWALSNLALVLELCTIPIALGVLSMPQATLYYWTTGMYSSLLFQKLNTRRESSKRGPGSKRIGLSPEAQSLLRQAAQRVSEQSPEKALPLLRQALLLHPDNTSIHMALGQVSSSLHAWKDAEYHYNVVAQGHHGDLVEQQALFGCAMVLLQSKGRREKAIELLEKAAQCIENRDDTFKPLAVRSLVTLAMLTTSSTYAHRAVALDPSCASSIKTYLELDDTKDA